MRFIVEVCGFGTNCQWQEVCGSDDPAMATDAARSITGYEVRVLDDDTGEAIFWMESKPRTVAEQHAAHNAILDLEAGY